MPYKPNERHYRSFAASNFQPVVRELPDDEEEKDEEPSYLVRGYWTTFSTEYLLYPRMGDFPAEYEQIDRHALDDADMSDVIFQCDHEGSPLARQRNGSLVLGTDEHGAWCEANLGGCQRGREIYESIKNGLIVEMSFGFTIANDEDGHGATYVIDEQGDYHTTITRISKIFDVSCVSIPANDSTEIHARSTIGAEIEAERRAAEEAKAAEAKAEQEAIEAEERAKVSRRKRRMRAIQLLDI